MVVLLSMYLAREGKRSSRHLRRRMAGELTMDELEAMDISEVSSRPEGEVTRLIKDLENSIHHLVRSNKELEEFMKETGNDKELRTAVGENVVIIARRRAILEDLQKSVPGGCTNTDSVSVPTPAIPAAAPPSSGGANGGKTPDGGLYL